MKMVIVKKIIMLLLRCGNLEGTFEDSLVTEIQNDARIVEGEM